MNINLRGTFFLTQAFARRMLAAPVPVSVPGIAAHRSIITVSSINATLPALDRAEYCFSKTGLAMMSQLFALRLAEAGICTYEIRPGIIRTDMTAPAAPRYDALIAGGLTPIARWGEPGDVGATVAALARGSLPFSTGQAFHVDGGMHIHKL
jgi:NAD(P)-dependent dehydrogenase (short-subunit alcohol dehydrogenase family)